MGIVWTAELDERLKSLWGSGLSGSQIGAEFGITRNAVLGRVHRLNIPAREGRPGWPDEKIGQFTRLWAEKVPAIAMAPQFGLCRQEVYKVARRLGLKPRGDEGPRARKKKRFGWVSMPKRIKRAAGVVSRVALVWSLPDESIGDIPLKQRKSFMELEPHHCRYPFGTGKDLYFCGAEKIKGLPYCGNHARLCYVPPNRQRASTPIVPAVAA